MTSTANVSMGLLAVVMAALVAYGVARAARREGDDATVARRRASFVLAGITLWLAVSAGLSAAGLLSRWDALPKWPLLPACAFVVIAIVVVSRRGRALIAHTPTVWLIGAQAFRIFVELAIHALYAEGRAPIHVTFEGRNFDIVVGLSALPIAWLVTRGTIARRGVVAWNLFGLVMLANTVVTIASSAPGPLHHDWGGAPLTAIADVPIVWLPAFLMPLAVFLHVASLRQASVVSRG